jgi:hypothetical protein
MKAPAAALGTDPGLAEAMLPRELEALSSIFRDLEFTQV